MSFSSVTIAVSDLPSFGGAVPGEMLVSGIFTVTPIVNRYTGKATRLCITAVEAAVSTSQFSKERSTNPPDCIRPVSLSRCIRYSA
jgi:hypothetical protein